MTRNIALTKLRDLLASLYSRRSDSERIAKDAGLDTKLIAFDDKAINNWSNILEEACRHDKVQAIINIARKEYPEKSKKLDDVSERLKNGEQLGLDISRDDSPSTLHPIVDRDFERRILIAALESPPEQAKSILLVEDSAGQGKTKLLELYKEYCGKHIPVAHVDLKGGSLDPIAILHIIQTDFGFPLRQCATVLQMPPVDVEGLSPERQNRWWADSARAFLDDLVELAHFIQIKRFVLLFDTFEQAMPETQTWIRDRLLRMAIPSRVPCLVIVVAGKEVPKPAGEWAPYCNPIPLQRLRLEDWIDYARQVNPSFELAKIVRLYDKFADDPIAMANSIGMLSGSANERVI
jgi:hypothetical protein